MCLPQRACVLYLVVMFNCSSLAICPCYLSDMFNSLTKPYSGEDGLYMNISHLLPPSTFSIGCPVETHVLINISPTHIYIYIYIYMCLYMHTYIHVYMAPAAATEEKQHVKQMSVIIYDKIQPGKGASSRYSNKHAAMTRLVHELINWLDDWPVNEWISKLTN